jgi:translation initiation factor IF-2
VGKLAEKKGVSLTQGEVIYRVLEGLCGVLGGYLPPVWEEEVTAVAEAKAVFPLNASSSKAGAPPSAAAGCVVVEGTFLKSAGLFRVVRGGEVLHEVKELTSLQHFKKKVESVKKEGERDERPIQNIVFSLMDQE